MPLPKLIDQIDHLFEQLIHQPWSRTPGAARRGADEHVLELKVPIGECERGHMSVAVEGRQIHVVLRRRAARGPGETAHEEQRQSFLLPENTDVSTLETRFEGDTLLLRVGLRRRRREP